MTAENDENKVKEYDIYKDSYFRYLGYANEVGESFRLLIPLSLVKLSYVVASCYVVADSVDKGYLMWKKPTLDQETKYRQTAIATTDTLIWQGLASVAIPGFTINRICWMTNQILKKFRRLPTAIRSWSVVAVGLGSIPFIIKPIDRATDKLMDATFRQLYDKF
uniref:Mitochondrial fission process protein 1 n=1 Tax=Arion vulgaris TaxID=1028688 RepID=A0A0B6Y8F5_9EUPU